MASKKNLILGERLKRLEDPPLITGQGRFADDINFPHQLHMRIVRSPYAHAEIKSINETLTKSGVVAIWTYDDIQIRAN